MLTYKDIDRIVSQVTGIPVKRIHSDRDKQVVCDARNIAMLMCREHLKLSTLALKKIYGKDSHTTILSDLRSAQNLIDTDSTAFTRINEIESLIFKREKKLREKKQIYNLHYRIRQKGFLIDIRSKTVSIQPDKAKLLHSVQLIKLLRRYGYNVQYSLI